MSQDQSPSEHSDSGYEKRDVSLGRVFIASGVVVVLLVVIVVFLYEYFVFEKEKQVFESTLAPESLALRELRAREDEELNSYKLLDSASGIYRIPIDRALEIVADEAFQSGRSRSR